MAKNVFYFFIFELLLIFWKIFVAIMDISIISLVYFKTFF